MRNAACFDVGGTFVKYGIINENGDILFKDRFPTPLKNCKETIPSAIIEKVKNMQESFNIDAIGISTAGQVDNVKGEIVSETENLPGYAQVKIVEVIEKKTNIDCYVENDVNAAALGEMWKGAGRGKDTFLCMTLGTGVGAAIVINGKLYRGVNGGAGEVGHMIINEGGNKCNCGMMGCYERYASTQALIRSYCKSEGCDLEKVNGEYIMDKVLKGDSAAIKVYDEFINHVVTGLVNLANILDPGLIVIGGGISSQGQEFFDIINKRFKSSAIPYYAEHTRIVQAELQNDAGLMGACFIALKQ